MCRLAPLPISESPLSTTSPRVQREQTFKLQLQINSACSGEVLLQSVAAEGTWTIRRLKLEIARDASTRAADQLLLFAGRLLADNEVLSTLLPQASEYPHVLMLVKSQPQVVAQPEASADSRKLSVVSDGGPVSCVRWLVEAHNLRRRAMTLTSPMFELSFGDDLDKVPFKLSLMASDDQSFARSQGRGFIQLKCLGGAPKGAACAGVLARVSSGLDVTVAAQEAFVDQEHCFATNAALKLPRGSSIDFGALMDRQRCMFEVAVEVVHVRKVDIREL
eukprot:CAMPEP_0115230622 /NCGR_PEP_ID=MMETSP0270-20121206/32811_1 /TAXON_ID=71861 /ORGANISM="Scrippsiella trochoidea, Strain CCMP3099" /LENGTH=276 /DNA_ID=CAMNT_0002645221 /DNA_START=59 /DNA_END=889 /DNA_ORIENTATION=-